MKELKKDLQAVTKELKATAKKTEKLTKAVDKLEKAQPAKKGKVKTKAKTTRKVTVKKAPAKKRVATEKKPSVLTATDEVIKIVKRSKKGVDVPMLIRKTGFEDKKVRNILMRASKLGKIKRAARGIYVAA
ncbi:MAG: hypothetical protein HWN68_12265 [Desulfobacterales bacterium]|nr:hypothetical protein [Desulfobacterales bacterium]